MSYMKSGRVIAKGKTKTIHAVAGTSGLVILESRDDLTKNDDPSQTIKLPDKAKLSNLTACGVFEAMRMTGFPIAYLDCLSNTEILAARCRMIPLEIVIRRFGAGSYLKRRGEPHATGHWRRNLLMPLVFEAFLKTEGGVIRDHHGNKLGSTPPDGKTGRPIDDPLIDNPNLDTWRLMHPKLPGKDSCADLGIDILASRIIPGKTDIRKIEVISRLTFLFLEAAWENLGYRLIDMKLEFGIDPIGQLVIADVIDNDNWRMSGPDGKEVSKQLFRDNASISDIQESYRRIAALASGKLSHQAISSSKKALRQLAAEKAMP